jgi:hypothetical protein
MAQVVWSAEAELFLFSAPLVDAEEILDSVERMAATGRGFVRNMLDGAGTLALYVGRYVVLFVVDDAGTIQVRKVRLRTR